MKLVCYYNCFVTVAYSKAKDLSLLIFLYFGYTLLTPVFTTCLRFTRLRHINPFSCISPGFHLARARPCGVNSAAGPHRCAEHRAEQEDACTFAHMWQKMLSLIGVKTICATTSEQIWGSLLMAPPLLNTFPKRRSVPINRVRHTKENSWHLLL